MSNSTSKNRISSSRNIIMAYSSKGIEKLRQRFFKKIRQDALKWGEESLDTAHTYYPPLDIAPADFSTLALSDLQMVQDHMYVPKVKSFGADFIRDVQQEWWSSRDQVHDHLSHQALEQDVDNTITTAKNELDTTTEEKPSSPRVALCGFYGKYLASSGFSLVLEFHNPHAFFSVDAASESSSAQKSNAHMLNTQHQGLVYIWRVDARERGTALKWAETEGDFYDQFGTYLDLHYGWRWLIQQHQQHQSMMIAEVAPGYMIGVRKGDPYSQEHPAEREDPQIQEVFSRFDIERFDSLEFLNHSESELLPFQAERYDEWLPSSLAHQLDQGEIELFTLSQAENFYEVIEELAERRKVELSWSSERGITGKNLDESADNSADESTDESATHIRFQRGPFYLQHDFAYAYLWALHTGRFWHEAAQSLFTHDLETLYATSDLYFKLIRELSDAEEVTVENGQVLVIKDEQGQVRIQVPLAQWAAQGVFDHAEGARQFLQMFGYEDGQWHEIQRRLDTCPVCGEGARIVKALRPTQHAQQLQQISTFNQDHLLGYYALHCPQHRVPIDWAETHLIERAFQQQSHHVIQLKADQVINGSRLIWAREIAGHLLSEDVQVRLQEEHHRYAYVFYPDVAVLSMMPLESDELESMRSYADHIARQWAADRMWPLNYSIPLQAQPLLQDEIKH